MTRTKFKHTKYVCSLIFALLINNTCTTAANYYWVNGSGNWSDFANHWASSSGGSSFHTGIPSSNDNVYFDANSFTQTGDTLHIDVQYARCSDFDMSQVINYPLIIDESVNNEIQVYGSFLLSSQLYFNYTKSVFLTCTTPVSYNVDLAGDSLSCSLSLEGVAGSSWNLQSDLIVRTILLRAGTINMNNHDINLSTFSNCAYYGPQVINPGTGKIILREVNPPYFISWSACKDLVLNNSNSDFYVKNYSATGSIFYDHHHYYPNIKIESNNNFYSEFHMDSSSIDKIEFTGSANWNIFNELNIVKIDSLVSLDSSGIGTIFNDNDTTIIHNIDIGHRLVITGPVIQPTGGFFQIDKIICNDSLEFFQENMNAYSWQIDSLYNDKHFFINVDPNASSDTVHINYCHLQGSGHFKSSSIINTLETTPGNNYLFEGGVNNYIDTLIATGTAAQNIQIKSDSAGLASTIILNKDFCGDYLQIQDMNVTAPSAFAGANSQDLLNNSGWSFTSCVLSSLSEKYKSAIQIKQDSHKLQIDLQGNPFVVELFNVAGKRIFKSGEMNFCSIDKINFAPGVYLCRINLLNGTSESINIKMLVY